MGRGEKGTRGTPFTWPQVVTETSGVWGLWRHETFLLDCFPPWTLHDHPCALP